ncbi:MAG: 16S rRNA (guanine(527)-N(7))-methyltransferase RsmG [Rickettsiales bacterium]
MHNNPFELLNNHFTVSRGTFERLNIYHNLLLKWQPAINLVGKDTISDAWSRHFLDSLQLTKHIDDKQKIITDLGSGAGFPGMILAIFDYQNIHLIESDARKIAFLREVARVTETKISIHHCRIENNPIDNVDIFVSRACAPLDKLLQLISESNSIKRVSRETICLFHKGKNYSIENENALLNWQYDLSVTPSIVDSQSVILRLANIRKV